MISALLFVICCECLSFKQLSVTFYKVPILFDNTWLY